VKTELLGLIRKHNKSFTESQLNDLIKRGSNSVFLDILGDVPHNKKARKDADSMQQLFIGVSRSPILNHIQDRAEKALNNLETLGLKDR